VLVAEDGSLRRVVAARQSLMRVTPCPGHGSAFDLLRAAYHLGNRHVVLELQPGHLQFEPDHVLAEMLRALHVEVASVEAAFEPEGGAYGGGHGGHGHPHPGSATHHAGRPDAANPGAATTDG
jgi:urease accessory protein